MSEDTWRNGRFVVHRHVDYPGRWLMSWYDIKDLKDRLLEAGTLEEAKVEAINHARIHLVSLGVVLKTIEDSL